MLIHAVQILFLRDLNSSNEETITRRSADACKATRLIPLAHPSRPPSPLRHTVFFDLSLHPPAIKTGAHLVFSGTFARSLWTRVTWIFFSAVWESSVIVETAIVQGDRASTCGAEIHLIYVRILFSGNRWIQSYCCYMIGLSLFSMVFTYVELERVYLEECIRWTGAWTPVNLYLAEVLHVRNDQVVALGVTFWQLGANCYLKDVINVPTSCTL